jgi:uncharacterized protein with FMN-binding domain
LKMDTIPPESKKPGRRKLSGGLLALGGAAVVSVYTVGYASSQSSIDDLTAQLELASPTATVAPAGGSSSTGRAATAAPTPAPSTATNASVRYVDGTYTGMGTSRHGSITATVVIEGGEIMSASVTNCQTRYPCSDVNALVSAVLTNQTVPTTNVSGATDSSRAYKTAVTQALQKALTGA